MRMPFVCSFIHLFRKHTLGQGLSLEWGRRVGRVKKLPELLSLPSPPRQSSWLRLRDTERQKFRVQVGTTS
jgi:hypothetical protein